MSEWKATCGKHTDAMYCKICLSDLVTKIQNQHKSKLKPLRDVYEKYKDTDWSNEEDAELLQNIIFDDLWQAIKNLFDNEEGK